jgi:hypothetical protein
MSSDLVYSEIEQTEVVTPAEIAASTGTVHEEASGRGPLFPGNELDEFRARWRQIQGDFVDEPRHAVEQANELVDRVTRRLTEVFTTERTRLEGEWGQGKDVSTEDLRQALRRYRSFFDRLLSV